MNKTEGSFQFGMKNNVRIRVFDKDNHIVSEQYRSNMCTKLALMGIIKFINGEFNESMPNLMSQLEYYRPRYLAVGTNQATVINEGVTTIVNVNDSKLLTEISPRIRLTQRNIIESRYTDPFMKLTIRCLIPTTYYNGETIREVGLFSKETGDNCFARIVLTEPINKTEDMVIDVTWEITVISLTTQVRSSDATLSNLVISDGHIVPEFSSAVTEYSISFPTGTSQVNVLATATNSEATINGIGSVTVTNDGRITITVTAEDESTKEYVVSTTIV